MKLTSNRTELLLSLLLVSIAAGCDGPHDPGSDAGDAPDASPIADAGRAGDASAGDDAGQADSGQTSAPTVRSNHPLEGATGVALDSNATVTFSEPMDASTLGAASFRLTSGDPAVAVPGAVIYSDNSAVFWPAEPLASDTTYTATITAAARSAAGVAIASDHVWAFTTGDTVRGPGSPVELGTAARFVILAKSGISTVPTSAVTGDLGVSPAAASAITGFSLTADSTNVFATSPQVTGRVFAADYAVPTPSDLTAAVSDMELAFTDAAGRAPDVTELGAGDIGGATLEPGVYAWGTGLLIPTDVTLTGSATDVWVFQIAQDLTVSSGVRVRLAGGALPQNVFWQVAGQVDLGTTAHFEGVVLTQTSITLGTGASIDGRLLAQTAVTIAGSTIVEPAE